MRPIDIVRGQRREIISVAPCIGRLGGRPVFQRAAAARRSKRVSRMRAGDIVMGEASKRLAAARAHQYLHR